jgi:hypothetical protein
MTATPTINPTGTPRSSRDPAVGTTEADALDCAVPATVEDAAEDGTAPDSPVAGTLVPASLVPVWLGAGCPAEVVPGEVPPGAVCAG